MCLRQAAVHSSGCAILRDNGMARARRFIHKISVPLLRLCIKLCLYNYVTVPDIRMFILCCDVLLKEALVITYQYFGRVTCVVLLEMDLSPKLPHRFLRPPSLLFIVYMGLSLLAKAEGACS